MPQRDVAARVVSLVVRPTVRDQARHAPDHVGRRRGGAVEVQDARDAAHGRTGESLD
jgi:hypothetical protein